MNVNFYNDTTLRLLGIASQQLNGRHFE
jgi:hypothetical protein